MTTDLGGWDPGQAVAIQADAKVVVVGTSDVGPTADGDDPSADFALVRYNANGSLDTSLSGDGTQTTDFSGGFDGGEDVAIEADGRIVVAGHAGEAPEDPFGGYVPNDFAVARYNADGALDASFSGDGKQTTDFGGDDFGSAVVVQADVPGSAVGRLSSESGASIHYTIDGSDPTSADRRFDPASPIQVAESQEVRAIAIDQSGNRSWVASHAYTIVPDYRITVLGTVGLVSYSRLGETSGMTAADARGANNGGYRNGVLLGRPSALLYDANASAGFDGSNDYVSVADHASLDTGDRFTLEAWSSARAAPRPPRRSSRREAAPGG